jgi:hypothetical protein
VCFLQITMNPVEDLPPDVVKVAQKVVLDLFPTKSPEIYETTYNRFMKWCEEIEVFLNDAPDHKYLMMNQKTQIIYGYGRKLFENVQKISTPLIEKF